MKLRLLVVVAALLAFAYMTPWSFSQDKGSGGPSDQSASGSTAPSSPSAPAVHPADPDKVKHDGGKDDVDAIGNRNVGCNKGLGNWYSVEKQIAMGKQYAQQVESSVKLIQDPVPDFRRGTAFPRVPVASHSKGRYRGREATPQPWGQP